MKVETYQVDRRYLNEEPTKLGAEDGLVQRFPRAKTLLATWLLGLACQAGTAIAQAADTDNSPPGARSSQVQVQSQDQSQGQARASTSASSREAPAEGVYDDRILFGQSAALSGPAGELGKSMQTGLLAAFQEAGSIHGRRLELISLDDGYEPALSIANTRILIEDENVFALIGAVGTPTSRAAVPIALDAKIPYIAPMTGAEFLRQEEWPNVVNLRASYYQETEAIVRYLVDRLKLKRIAVFHQDDSFGQTGYEGSRLALARRDLEVSARSVYPRNTKAVKSGLLELRNTFPQPQAVVVVGSYQPVAELVAWARRIGFNPVFMTLSFVGSNALSQELEGRGDGVRVTQVVPFPWGDDLPLLKEYRAALETLSPDARPGFVSLEGYLAGRLAVEALRRLGADVTREQFLAELTGMQEVNLSGLLLSFTAQPFDNQGSDDVYLTKLDEKGNFHPVANN